MKIDTLCILLRGEAENEIYLGIKKRGFGKGKHVGVGGGVEQGELPLQAAIREIKEETNLELAEHNLEKMGRIHFEFPAKREWDRLVHVYKVTGWEGDPIESDEIEPHWFSLTDIPYDLMWQDGRYWLPHILANEKIEAHFIFEADNESLKLVDIQAAKDFLMTQLNDLPYFRGMLRAVEASYYQDFHLPAPIYDIGCGDGHFAGASFDFKVDVGLDPWWTAIQEAPKHKGYQSLVVAEGAETPFPDQHFACAISNSVLEHIPDIDAVLTETNRILKDEAQLFFCVPNPRYFSELSIPALLRKAGLSFLAEAYTRWFGKVSRVYHADDPQVWQARLKQAGFQLEHYWHYFSPAAMRALEWGHYFGVPALISRILFKRWVLMPTRWNLALTYAYAKKFTQNQPDPQGAFTFYIARKLAQ